MRTRMHSNVNEKEKKKVYSKCLQSLKRRVDFSDPLLCHIQITEELEIWKSLAEEGKETKESLGIDTDCEGFGRLGVEGELWR